MYIFRMVLEFENVDVTDLFGPLQFDFIVFSSLFR